MRRFSGEIIYGSVGLIVVLSVWSLLDPRLVALLVVPASACAYGIGLEEGSSQATEFEKIGVVRGLMAVGMACLVLGLLSLPLLPALAFSLMAGGGTAMCLAVPGSLIVRGRRSHDVDPPAA